MTQVGIKTFSPHQLMIIRSVFIPVVLACVMTPSYAINGVVTTANPVPNQLPIQGQNQPQLQTQTPPTTLPSPNTQPNTVQTAVPQTLNTTTLSHPQVGSQQGATKQDANKADTTKQDASKQEIITPITPPPIPSVHVPISVPAVNNVILKNQVDNLSEQIHTMHKERSTEFFMYGALTLFLGTIFGFLMGRISRKEKNYW